MAKLWAKLLGDPIKEIPSGAAAIVIKRTGFGSKNPCWERTKTRGKGDQLR